MSSTPRALCLAKVLRPTLHEDVRGWLFEIASARAPFKVRQLYAVGVAPGQTRGEHFHKRKTELFAVVSGVCLLRLMAYGRQCEYIALGPAGGDALAVVIPPGIWHAFTNDAGADGDAVVIAAADEYYDPEDEDTFRETPTDYVSQLIPDFTSGGYWDG